jgi:hypothetical protein
MPYKKSLWRVQIPLPFFDSDLTESESRIRETLISIVSQTILPHLIPIDVVVTTIYLNLGDEPINTQSSLI